MKLNLLLLSLLILCSCKKLDDNAEAITCNEIKNATITSNSPVTIGQTVSFGTKEISGSSTCTWRGPNNFLSQSFSNTLMNVELQNEGWYYLQLSSSDGSCEKIDSVFIDIKLQQGNPPCVINNNTTTYNNMSTDNYTSVTKGIDGVFSQKYLSCSGGNLANLNIYFQTYWRTKEPEDGIYFTTNTPTFSQTDLNYNKVFITTSKNSIYWTSNQNQMVYISHVGSKLQVRFCSLNMTGSNGTIFNTIASGNVVEQ